jgi:hypothetical protein
MNEKYRIAIPYRDRKNNLIKITPSLIDKFKDMDVKIQIIEQDNDLPFNLAYLVNIGFDIFKKEEEDLNWNYIFHPVDCYPIDIDYNIYDKDIVGLYQTNEIWPKAFCFNASSFLRMNGYSNDYWGWGGEDWEPEKKANAFNMKFEKRYVTFDKTEDVSAGNNYTNQINIHKCNSKSLEDFIQSGLNTISYTIKDKKCDIVPLYKVDFKKD